MTTPECFGLLGRLADLVVTPQHQLGQADLGGHPGGQRSTGRSLLGHGGQPFGQAVPADRIEPVQHVGAGHPPLALEERLQFDQRVVAVRCGVDVGGRQARQALQLHIEVAHGSEEPGQPAELLAEHLGPDRQHGLEHREGGAQTARRHAHVVQLLGILAESRPRFLGLHHGELPPEYGEGDIPHGGLGGDVGRPEVGRPGDLLPESQEACFELGEVRRLEPAGPAQLLHDRLQRVEPFRVDLDLDAPKLHGALPGADDDHRVVERDLRHVGTTDPQREGAASSAHLEHFVQPAGTDDGAQSAPDRTVVPEPGQSGRGEDLGDLQTLTQAASLRWTTVLERDFVVAAAASGADDEAGAGNAPVVTVEIGVDEPPRRSSERGHGPSVARLDGESREGGQPALDRPQIEGVELPFDLDGIVPARPVCLGI